LASQQQRVGAGHLAGSAVKGAADAQMDAFLLEAMREVDALTPACPPIAPPDRDEWLASLVVPDAGVAEVWPAGRWIGELHAPPLPRRPVSR
jgi:hypothetical protein